MSTEGTPRTFEPVKISFDRAREIFQVDKWTRERVPEDKVTETVIILDATLKFRGLSQEFLIEGRIRAKRFDLPRLEAKVRAAVVAGLPNRIVWDFFRPADVVVTPEGPEMEDYEGDSQIDSVIAPRLEEQAKLGNAAVEGWKAALQEIEDGLQGGYEYNRRQIQAGMMFFDWCHRAANNGMMYSWCEEKLARIRSGLADLARRKNTNHPNYTSTVDNICGWLRSWPVVNSWHENPPRPKPSSPKQ